MKLDTLLKRKDKVQKELNQVHCLYDNLQMPASHYTRIRNLEMRIGKLKKQIAEELKKSDEYNEYLRLKQKFAEYNLS